jgi:hypothetical protein
MKLKQNFRLGSAGLAGVASLALLFGASTVQASGMTCLFDPNISVSTSYDPSTLQTRTDCGFIKWDALNNAGLNFNPALFGSPSEWGIALDPGGLVAGNTFTESFTYHIDTTAAFKGDVCTLVEHGGNTLLEDNVYMTFFGEGTVGNVSGIDDFELNYSNVEFVLYLDSDQTTANPSSAGNGLGHSPGTDTVLAEFDAGTGSGVFQPVGGGTEGDLNFAMGFGCVLPGVFETNGTPLEQGQGVCDGSLEESTLALHFNVTDVTLVDTLGGDDQTTTNLANIETLVVSGVSARSTFTAPEPASAAMMGLGLLALGGLARRKNNRRS